MYVDLYDAQLIITRVLCMQKVREINLKDVLSYELAGILPSMFDEKSEEMHLSTSKSKLKTKLQVQVTGRRSVPADVIILDECAILSLIDWPAHGTVKDLSEM